MVTGKRDRRTVFHRKIQKPCLECMLYGGISFVVLVCLFYGVISGCGVVLKQANNLGRQCLLPDSGELSGEFKVRIAMVTCSEESGAWGGRSFRGLMGVIRENKKSYAEKKGYDFIDGSKLVDMRRPPSWSKIVAVKAHLRNYDWVFWNDADSLITNSSISLESILQAMIGAKRSTPDLILTEDSTGINAGMFLIKNSEWSLNFLDTWWNQTSFIRGFGSTKSGDNDALKYLIKHLPENELRNHVRVSPMQCLFNSYPWSPTLKTAFRLLKSPKTIWQGVYSNGDFMVHLAGLDQKKEWAVKILREMNDG